MVAIRLQEIPAFAGMTIPVEVIIYMNQYLKEFLVINSLFVPSRLRAKHTL